MMLATNYRKAPTTRVAPDRFPSGQKRQGVAPAVFHRIREHGVRLGLDPRLATVLGRMGLFNELSAAEVDAGFRIAEIYGRYESLTGMPRRSAASPSYQSGYGSKGMDEGRMDPDELKRHHRAERRAQKALDRLHDWIPSDGALRLIEQVVVDDQNINPAYKGELAAVLHRVAEKFGIIAETKKPTKGAPAPHVEDGALLATATIEALIAHFDQHFASKPTCFSLVDNPDWKKSRGITASDGCYHYTVAVPLRHLSVKAMDAQLRLACAVAGLLEIRDAETGEVE